MAVDPHCRIGRVRFKGARHITTRLPKKALQVARELQAAADKQRQGRAGQ